MTKSYYLWSSLSLDVAMSYIFITLMYNCLLTTIQHNDS